MGYESRIYVVEKTRYDVVEGGREMKWGEMIAAFNLCDVPGWSGEMHRFEDTEVYFVENSRGVIKDAYGKNLKEIPLDEALKILKREQEEDDYRRYAPCIAYLEALDRERWKEAVVLHYGY